MALRTGRQGNPLLVDRRVRVHFGLNPVDAMTCGAGRGIESSFGRKNTVDTLMRLDLPAGVDVEIKVFSRQGNR